MIQDIAKLLMERWDFFGQLLLEHLLIAGLSSLVAMLAGLLLGIIISEYPPVSAPVIGATNILYTIPSISLLGFLLPATGIGNTTAIIALVVYGLLPIIRSTYTGIQNIDSSMIQTAKGMGSTRWQILFLIKLPLAFPVILSGLRTMVVMTISLAGIASFIGAGGLGVAVYRGIATNNLAMTAVGSLLIAVIAILADRLLHIPEKNILRKRG